MFVHQHIVLPHDVESLLLSGRYGEPFPRQPGAGDDEALEQDAQHLFAQAVLDRVLACQLVCDFVQCGRSRRIGPQPYRFRAAVKKQPVAGYFVVVAVNAIEIAVEQQRQVVARDLAYRDAVQRCERNHFPGFERRLYMVDLQAQRAAAHPDEFVKAAVPPEGRVGMESVGQHDCAFEPGM